MTEFEKDILSALIDSYEKRAPENTRKVSVDIQKKYPQYRDVLSEKQEQIEAAIQHLQSWGFITGRKDLQGYYSKVCMAEDKAADIYRFLQRMPKAQLIQRQKELLERAAAGTGEVTRKFCNAMLERIAQRKELPYGLGKRMAELEDILLVLEPLEKLTKETYIRNFSEMVFHDSKRLQTLLGTLSKILMDHGEEGCQKETVLAQYNLISNPSYVYIKGPWQLRSQGQCMSVKMFPGGVALPSRALESIDRIGVPGKRVISVENLTTYHDASEEEGAILYLGGFHNTVRTNFLRKLYAQEPDAVYCHKGDLDPYGFLILENLKKKTGIPFLPMEMDLDTLKRCHMAGHFRPLDEADKKALISPALAEYRPILQYMADHDCKLEQECFEAMKLERMVEEGPHKHQGSDDSRP